MSINRHLSDLAKSIDSASPGDFLGIHDSGGGNFHHVINGVFDVVNNGTSAYTFTGSGFSSGSDNPTLYLYRGQKYRFNVAATGHPFEIRLSNGGSAYNTGVINNAAADGAIIFAPDMSAPNSLVYQCTVHSGMVGDIVILDNTSFLDSAETINLIDSAYVIERQLKSHAIGGKYRFDTSTTAGDPGSGDIRLSIDWTTGIEGNSYYAYVSETDKDGIGIAPLLDQLTVSTNTNKALVVIYKADAPTTNAKFYVTGQTDNGSYRTLDITYVDRDAWGQISNGDEIFMSLSIVGDKGDTSGSIDSAGVVSLVDSAYVQARQTTVGSGGGGLDSAAVTSLVDSAYISNRFPTGGSSTIIAPIAFARVATTSNGSDRGISWSNWNSGTGEMDFTLSTAQPDTNYIVVTDAETFDDYYVGISSKTVNGFTASFYDGSGVRSPSPASPFAIIVYGSTPTQRIAGDVGNFLDSAAVTSLVDSAYVSARSSGGGGAGLSSFNIVSQHITSSQVVESDQNAFSVGPTIVDSSVTLTIKSGARYVVI